MLVGHALKEIRRELGTMYRRRALKWNKTPYLNKRPPDPDRPVLKNTAIDPEALAEHQRRERIEFSNRIKRTGRNELILSVVFVVVMIALFLMKMVFRI
jgi:hypothetical protein